MNRISQLLSALSMALLLAAPAAAQQLYVHGGVGFPTSSAFNDAYNTGFTVGLGVGVPITTTLEGVVRGSYDRFGLDGEFNGGDFAAYSATGNLKVKMPLENAQFAPYILGGAGVFRLGVEDNYETKIGLQFGAGVDVLRMRRVNFMLEPNYVLVFHEGENTQYFPIRLGAAIGL